MLLALGLLSEQRARRSTKPTIASMALFLLAALAAHAQEPPPPCILEVPVYGPFGDRLPFRVIRVTPENDKSLNLLSIERDGVKITSKGDRIFFSSNRIVGGRAIEVTLEGPKGARVTSRMIVTACRLRRSLFFGESDLGHHVSGVRVTGRLSGCKYDGDWWVRAMPMFGGHEGFPIADGYVESDGTFWLVVADYGVRQLLVIGKDKQPVKCIGFDVTIGKVSDVGVVDLSGQCPKQ